MTLFSAVMVLLKIAAAVLDHIKYRRALTEGERQALAKIQGEINEKVKRALAARDAVDPDRVSDDPNNRDNG